MKATPSFISAARIKYLDIELLMRERSFFGLQFQVMAHHSREITTAGAQQQQREIST